MKNSLALCLLISLLFPVAILALEPQQLDDINYSFGHFLGNDLMKASVELRMDQLLDGLFDATEKLEAQYSAAEMKALLTQKKPQEEDALQKINYSYGYKTGSEIAAVEIEFNAEPLLYGVTDVIDKKKPRLTKKEMTALLKQLKKASP